MVEDIEDKGIQKRIIIVFLVTIFRFQHIEQVNSFTGITFTVFNQKVVEVCYIQYLTNPNRFIFTDNNFSPIIK